MNTYEFLNMLETIKDCDGFNRDGDDSLMFYTNQAEGLLGYGSTEQKVIFDEATGELPALITSDGVFRYDAPSNDYWRIGYILTPVSSYSPLLNPFASRDYGYRYPGTEQRLEQIVVSGIYYYRLPFIRSHDRTEADNAYVVFTEDPGDTTDVYKWYGFEKPTDLLSDSIPLAVPPPFDMKYLFPATLLLIQGVKSGNMVEALGQIDVLKQKYDKELNKGEQGVVSDAYDRGF